MGQASQGPENREILGFLHTEVVGEAGWCAFLGLVGEEPDQQQNQDIQYGEGVDSDGTRWSLWEEHDYVPPGAISIREGNVSSEPRFSRQLSLTGIFEINGDEEDDITYTISLGSGVLSSLLNGEPSIRESPQEEFLRGIRVILDNYDEYFLRGIRVILDNYDE